ncbi:MAG TPA: DUF421 domain-containing protein [Ruminococcus sp.]|nr:DUF421 domain-containing protein [Ruminococcus sp.]
MDFRHALITAPVSLLVLFILSKLIGNKQMANLNLFDYINGITIGSIAAEMATNGFDAFFECLIALIIYAAVVILLSYLSQKSIALRRFFTGKTIVLYDKGKIYKKNLMTAKIDMNEFLSMLRNKGYFCLEDIETAYLEQNGQLSVLVKSNKSPVTPFDMKIRVNHTRPEVVVISDGKVFEKNLKSTGNNTDWLNRQLKIKGQKQKDIFLAVCDGDNNLKIYEISDKRDTNDPFE